MKTRVCLINVCWVVFSALFAVAERPNIVFILLDDVGTGWIPPYADRLSPPDVETEIVDVYSRKMAGGRPVDVQKHIEAARRCMPTLSRLAREGAVFDNCFTTTSLCAPSRSGLLTGTFQQRWGAYRNPDVDHHGIPADQALIAGPLQQAGYRCAAIGKWHVSVKDESLKEKIWTDTLGRDLPMPQSFNQFNSEWRDTLERWGYTTSCKPGQHPLDRGFDYYFGYNLYQSRFFNALGLWENHDLIPPRPDGEFLTELFNDKSCAFIESALKDEKPFFLYYAPMTLHGPVVPPPEKYSEPFDAGVAFSDEYAGHLFALDKGIEQIFQTLEKYNQTQNTLFVFSCDNGCTSMGVPPYNAPNRGGKGSGWLGGLNVPLVIWWPGKVQRKVTQEAVSQVDLFPTLLEAASVNPPSNIDGKSLLPFLRGETEQGPREAVFAAGIHSSRWSYSYEADGEWNKKDASDCPMYVWTLQDNRVRLRMTATPPGLYKVLPDGLSQRAMLFDLKTDRKQHHDIANESPELVQQMDASIHRWLGAMNVPWTSQQEEYQTLLEQTR